MYGRPKRNQRTQGLLRAKVQDGGFRRVFARGDNRALMRGAVFAYCRLSARKGDVRGTKGAFLNRSCTGRTSVPNPEGEEKIGGARRPFFTADGGLPTLRLLWVFGRTVQGGTDQDLFLGRGSTTGSRSGAFACRCPAPTARGGGEELVGIGLADEHHVDAVVAVLVGKFREGVLPGADLQYPLAGRVRHPASHEFALHLQAVALGLEAFIAAFAEKVDEDFDGDGGPFSVVGGAAKDNIAGGTTVPARWGCTAGGAIASSVVRHDHRRRLLFAQGTFTGGGRRLLSGGATRCPETAGPRGRQVALRNVQATRPLASTLSRSTCRRTAGRFPTLLFPMRLLSMGFFPARGRATTGPFPARLLPARLRFVLLFTVTLFSVALLTMGLLTDR